MTFSGKFLEKFWHNPHIFKSRVSISIFKSRSQFFPGHGLGLEVSVSPTSLFVGGIFKAPPQGITPCLSVSTAEMSGLWNFSVRVQSWSAKVESDPALIRKFLKIISPIQSWSANIKPCILFRLMKQNSLMRQNRHNLMRQNRHILCHFQKLIRQCSFCHQRQKHCWSYLPLDEPNW